MKRLEPITSPTTEMAVVTARLTMKGGRELWMCDAYSHIAEAISEGEPFEAHMIIGMEPKQIVINPAYVATLQREA